MDEYTVDFGPDFKPLPMHKGTVRHQEVLTPMPEHLWGHGFEVDTKKAPVVQ